MAYDYWDAIKDGFGMVGPFLLARPWFRDNKLRKIWHSLRDVRAEGSLGERIKRLNAAAETELVTWKPVDFWWTVGGLACIFLSFAIALVHGLAGG